MPAQPTLTNCSYKRPAKRRNREPKPEATPVFIPDNTIGPSLVELFNYHNEQGETLLAYSTLLSRKQRSTK